MSDLFGGEPAALERLKRAARVVADILDAGERDPTWGESQELEEAAIAYGRGTRVQEANSTSGDAPARNHVLQRHGVSVGPENVPTDGKARASAIIEVIRSALASADSLPTHEQDQIALALVSLLRAWKPESVSPLGTLPPPTESIRDPRGRA